jgi:ATP-dependent helicase HrpB
MQTIPWWPALLWPLPSLMARVRTLASSWRFRLISANCGNWRSSPAAKARSQWRRAGMEKVNGCAANAPWNEAEPALIRSALLEGLRQLGLEALPWDPASRQLQHRLNLAHQHLGDPWPDCSPQQLLEQLEEWLGPHLNGLRSRDDLQGLPLGEALWGNAPWSLRPQLDQLLPVTLTVPSGRKVKLDYSSGQPVLAVKLQELFGAHTNPMVLSGQLAVTVHLLTPAGRPAAITQDLAGFWERSYPEVRKELRGRYPRHPWPEDPGQAQATALTKARLQQGNNPA